MVIAKPLSTVLASALVLAGCETITAPLLGAGAGAAIKEKKESQVAETFTHPLPRTKSAVLVALKRMGIQVDSTAPHDKGERIMGKAKERTVEIHLAPVTDKATRMTVKIGDEVKGDRATAEEVVQQTQRALRAT